MIFNTKVGQLSQICQFQPAIIHFFCLNSAYKCLKIITLIHDTYIYLYYSVKYLKVNIFRDIQRQSWSVESNMAHLQSQLNRLESFFLFWL